jgi:hypothetical protein
VYICEFLNALSEHKARVTRIFFLGERKIEPARLLAGRFIEETIPRRLVARGDF